MSKMGSRCKLRPVCRHDAKVSLEWRNNPKVRDAVMGYRFPVTEVMEDKWYDQRLADQGGKRATFAIDDLSDGAFVGFVHLYDIDWICQSSEVGVVIGATERQGKGLGSEAVRKAVDYAFLTLNLKRITCRCLANNEASIRTFTALGFVREGTLRRAAFVDGANVDVVLMALLREEDGAA